MNLGKIPLASASLFFRIKQFVSYRHNKRKAACYFLMMPQNNSTHTEFSPRHRIIRFGAIKCQALGQKFLPIDRMSQEVCMLGTGKKIHHQTERKAPRNAL